MVLQLEAAGAAGQSGTGLNSLNLRASATPWAGGPRRTVAIREPVSFDTRDAFSELLGFWMARPPRAAAVALPLAPHYAPRARPKAQEPDAIAELAYERLKNGSMSFAKAARLFPEELRPSAFMLYAWCRHCDDEIDGQVLGAAPLARPDGSGAAQAAAERTLAELRAKTEAALAGRADEPVFIGLKRVAARHHLPPRYPLDLIEGMAMDVAGRTYATLDDTLSYAYYVAGVVGVMMATIMGVRDRATLERASDLGIAFQLTNIARDVVPDALQGRVYLPARWLAAEGVPAAEVADPRHRGAVFKVTARLLDVADAYYRSAAAGIGHLPFRSAWAIASARRVYRGIGCVVRARGERAWDKRARCRALAQFAGIAVASGEAAAFVAARGRLKAPPRDGLWTPTHLWPS
jgi:phytoene synthase